jgi:hypothetical protein
MSYLNGVAELFSKIGYAATTKAPISAMGLPLYIARLLARLDLHTYMNQCKGGKPSRMRPVIS